MCKYKTPQKLEKQYNLDTKETQFYSQASVKQ